MPLSAKQPITPSPGKRVVGWIAVTILFMMFAAALFGDVFIWVIYGTKFILSPAFTQAEGWLRSLLGASFIGFLIFERGAEHLQQKRWKPFLLGVLIFIIATLPFAKPCALLARFAIFKGVGAMAQPKIALLVLLAMIIFACKCRGLIILWRLIRRPSQPQDIRRIIISE